MIRINCDARICVTVLSLRFLLFIKPIWQQTSLVYDCAVGGNSRYDECNNAYTHLFWIFLGCLIFSLTFEYLALCYTTHSLACGIVFVSLIIEHSVSFIYVFGMLHASSFRLFTYRIYIAQILHIMLCLGYFLRLIIAPVSIFCLQHKVFTSIRCCLLGYIDKDEEILQLTIVV